MILEFPVRSNWLIITLHTNAADYSQIELHPSQVDPPPQYCMYNSNTFRTWAVYMIHLAGTGYKVG